MVEYHSCKHYPTPSVLLCGYCLKEENERLRELLRDLRPLVRCENLHHRKADQHSGFGPCPVAVRMLDRIDAALKEPA